MSCYMLDFLLIQSLEEAGFGSIRVLPESVIRHSNRLSAALPPGVHAVMAALPYDTDPPHDLSTGGDPHGFIEPFARRHYYKEAAEELKRVLKSMSTGTGHKQGGQFRFFSNSRFPEKEMAVSAGMGFIGRNNLVINPSLGTRFIIAGCLIPITLLPGDGIQGPDSGEIGKGGDNSIRCCTCAACASACPTRALSDGKYPGITFDKSRCLQYYSTRLEELPEFIMTAWGKRLYGCGVCQEVCPYNKSNLRNSPKHGIARTGVLGPSLSLTAILSMDDDELKRQLKGTALGMIWISPLVVKRNAILASAHAATEYVTDKSARHSAASKGKNALPARLFHLLEEYSKHQAKAVNCAAKWALSGIEG